MIASGVTNDNEWKQLVQRVAAGDNEWQRVTANDNKWQQMTTNDNEWKRVVQWMKMNERE